jgi:hypothetical protein
MEQYLLAWISFFSFQTLKDKGVGVMLQYISSRGWGEWWRGPWNGFVEFLNEFR